MASGPPPMLSDTQRSMKRTMARDGMVRKYDEIILRYANVQPFIPRIDDIVPKNIWERQMQRAREPLVLFFLAFVSSGGLQLVFSSSFFS